MIQTNSGDILSSVFDHKNNEILEPVMETFVVQFFCVHTCEEN